MTDSSDTITNARQVYDRELDGLQIDYEKHCKASREIQSTIYLLTEKMRLTALRISGMREKMFAETDQSKIDDLKAQIMKYKEYLESYMITIDNLQCPLETKEVQKDIIMSDITKVKKCFEAVKNNIYDFKANC